MADSGRVCVSKGGSVRPLGHCLDVGGVVDPVGDDMGPAGVAAGARLGELILGARVLFVDETLESVRVSVDRFELGFDVVVEVAGDAR